VRIQFDISENDIQRLDNYIPDLKYRHVFAHKALVEWITRQEGRDRRFKNKKREQTAREIQEMIDSGLVKV